MSKTIRLRALELVAALDARRNTEAEVLAATSACALVIKDGLVAALPFANMCITIDEFIHAANTLSEKRLLHVAFVEAGMDVLLVNIALRQVDENRHHPRMELLMSVIANLSATLHVRLAETTRCFSLLVDLSLHMNLDGMVARHVFQVLQSLALHCALSVLAYPVLIDITILALNNPLRELSAVATLTRLAHHCACALHIVTKTRFCATLRELSQRTRDYVVAELIYLSRHAEVCVAMVKVGYMAQLVEMMHGGPSAVSDAAVTTVRNVCVGYRLAAQSVSIDALFALLAVAEKHTVVDSILTTLWIAAHYHVCATAMTKHYISVCTAFNATSDARHIKMLCDIIVAISKTDTALFALCFEIIATKVNTGVPAEIKVWIWQVMGPHVLPRIEAGGEF